jgi:hypothetical protein
MELAVLNFILLYLMFLLLAKIRALAALWLRTPITCTYSPNHLTACLTEILNMVVDHLNLTSFTKLCRS